MKIVETNFKFAVVRRQGTRYILVHHSASDHGDAFEINRWHLDKGWSGIGYHYVILKDGTIQRGRPEYAVGAQCYGQRNYDSIAICLIGNFEKYAPTKEQMKSLIWLIKDIRGRYGELPVQRHSDHQSTACPGRLFPYQEVIKELEVNNMPDWKRGIMLDAKEAGLITSDHNPDDVASKWFVLAVALNLLKISRGGK